MEVKKKHIHLFYILGKTQHNELPNAIMKGV